MPRYHHNAKLGSYYCNIYSIFFISCSAHEMLYSYWMFIVDHDFHPIGMQHFLS